MKPKFNLEDYKEKYVAMHCETEEEAKSFCEFLHNAGRTWYGGKLYIKHTKHEDYDSDTCYDFNDNTYCDIGYFKSNNYKILKWSDFSNFDEWKFFKDVENEFITLLMKTKLPITPLHMGLPKVSLFELDAEIETMKKLTKAFERVAVTLNKLKINNKQKEFDNLFTEAEIELGKMEEKQTFTKDDLKTGMLVELRNGSRYIVLRGDLQTKYYGTQEFILMRLVSFETSDTYNQDLTNSENKSRDIQKVYTTNMRGLKSILTKDNLKESTLIWERKEEVEPIKWEMPKTKINAEFKNEFTKDNLKTGMLVELRNGSKGIVLKNSYCRRLGLGDYITFKGGYPQILNLVTYSEEMLFDAFKKNSKYDIIKVYIADHQYHLLSWDLEHYKLLWGRKEEQPKPFVKFPLCEDIEVMKAMHLLYGCKYFVEDESSRQYAYIKKPTKFSICWETHKNDCYEIPFTKELSHISWEDDEPYEYIPQQDTV